VYALMVAFDLWTMTNDCEPNMPFEVGLIAHATQLESFALALLNATLTTRDTGWQFQCNEDSRTGKSSQAA